MLDFQKVLLFRNGLTDFRETWHTEVVLCRMDKTYETTATFQYEPKKNGKNHRQNFTLLSLRAMKLNWVYTEL
jgi:hypothetical protein